MTAVHDKASADLVLPASVVSKVDVSRLVSELEKVDNELTAAAIHKKAGVQLTDAAELPQRLSDFLHANKLTLGDSTKRSQLIKQLRRLKDNVPVIHMTFAAETDRESLEQLAHWVRSSVHPQAVIAASVQPALVAGVYVRTPNRVYDLSLREALKSNRAALAGQLGAARGKR